MLTTFDEIVEYYENQDFEFDFIVQFPAKELKMKYKKGDRAGQPFSILNIYGFALVRGLKARLPVSLDFGDVDREISDKIKSLKINDFISVVSRIKGKFSAGQINRIGCKVLMFTLPDGEQITLRTKLKASDVIIPAMYSKYVLIDG